MEKEEKKPNYTFIRVFIIGCILMLLIFISIGIVRFVPQALNSLASASLSIGPLFSNSNTPDPLTSDKIATSTATSTRGFSIRELTANDTTNTISGNTSGIGSSENAGRQTGQSGQSTGQQDTNKPQTSPSTPLSSANTTSESSTYRAPTPSSIVGPSDIAVEILSIGILDASTGTFIPSQSFTTTDTIIVKFKIENRGTYATGKWSARVEMPSSIQSDAVRILGPIASIPAGSAIVGEARFNSALPGNQQVVISVDTAQVTQDQHRSNNTISIPISIGGISSSNNGSYTGQPDLSVRVLSTGTVNAYGQFTPNTMPRYGEKAAVRFEVLNNGGTASGSWSWRADITGAQSSTYVSPLENSIASGRSSTFIVGLETNQYTNTGIYYGSAQQYYTGTINFNIVIDTQNTVFESNESNNSAYASVQI